MQQASLILITALGTYGLSALIADYTGPFKLFVNLRKHGVPDCLVCVATWLILPMLLIVWLGFGIPFAVLGVIIILVRVV